jgi:multidrug resistance efflux pump
LRAGAWHADLTVSAAAVTQAEAELTRIQTELELHQIHAPHVLDGAGQPVEWEVLQVNVRPGEYVGTPPGEPLVVLGDAGPRHVRVDIDEHDIPRFHTDGAASAYIRGDAHRAFDLRFVRLEPYVVPKKSLTGDSAERVDTRVLQAIYVFSRVVPDVHVGQQVDVYINAQRGAGTKRTPADQ